MSVVSGVTLICGLAEDEYDDGRTVLANLNGVLKEMGFTVVGFKELADEHYGGNKHPQHYTFGAGLNCLDEDLFAKKIMSWSWKTPENTVLIIQPEDGETRIFRPPYTP